MKHRNRMPSWRKILVTLGLVAAGGGLACQPAADGVSGMSITAEVLDRIDAAMEERAFGRWASWSMKVTGRQLAFQVELAEASAADVCSGIGEVVRLAGDDIAWSADLTRDGQALTRCGTLSLLAHAEPASARAPRS
jgi:hypothetical protein